ncbi:hypothetical protein RUM43_006380 [Polyplax serrata]|uniref:Uncharacterized protein n=1 Tax=Polyplax serrata TaxID=468196 RepID=A0AAN8PYN0_POLSC
MNFDSSGLPRVRKHPMPIHQVLRSRKRDNLTGDQLQEMRTLPKANNKSLSWSMTQRVPSKTGLPERDREKKPERWAMTMAMTSNSVVQLSCLPSTAHSRLFRYKHQF